MHKNLAFIELTYICKKYITCILNLFISKQLTINKCTLLYCTNTEILMYHVYTYSTHLRFGKLYTHSFGTDTHT